MTTMGEILANHFRGNSAIGDKPADGRTTLEEFLEQIKVDIQVLEAFVAGLQDPKDSVRLCTAGALPAYTAAGSKETKTLTGNVAAALSVDGEAVAVDERVMINNDGTATGADRGIYVATNPGSGSEQWVLTRASDANTDAEVTSGMTVPVAEGTANGKTVWMLTTNDPIVLDTTALTFTRIVPYTHAATHITGAADEVDGDQVDIDYTPSNYTPSTAPAEVTSVDHLTAHLAGVDDEMSFMAQNEGSSAVVQLIQGGQPVANDTLVVGADTYEADGVGANINFAIAGTAEGTMDNLLAAAVASGTEFLYWDKLDATTLRLRSADAKQGNIIGADSSIGLDASSLTNYSFDSGNVNMNSLAGQSGKQLLFANAELPITTAMITAGSVRIAFPFTPTRFTLFAITAAGIVKVPGLDTFAIAGDDIVVTLNGAGGDLANTDVLRVTAYA